MLVTLRRTETPPIKIPRQAILEELALSARGLLQMLEQTGMPSRFHRHISELESYAKQEIKLADARQLERDLIKCSQEAK